MGPWLALGGVTCKVTCVGHLPAPSTVQWEKQLGLSLPFQKYANTNGHRVSGSRIKRNLEYKKPFKGMSDVSQITDG